MLSYMPDDKDCLSDILDVHAMAMPHQAAFVMLDAEINIKREVSFALLSVKVRKLATGLQKRGLAGHRVVLVYTDTIEFMVAFLACQRSGVVPVPVSTILNRKQFSRLLPIIRDAQATAICCQSHSVALLANCMQSTGDLYDVELIDTDTMDSPDDQILPTLSVGVSFIQYTSGSTGMPKGVMVSKRNLIANQRLLTKTFCCTPRSIILSWLPFHHDMGLIGNLLHTVYTGCTCYLILAYQVIQSPIRWLKAISRYRATHSGGPNFSYDFCVDRISNEEVASLDLSCWIVAFNGSEPVRAATLARFSERFRPAGFNPTAFFPCYGLAEATLLVSGEKEINEVPLELCIERTDNGCNRICFASDQSAPTLVSAGQVPDGMKLIILGKDDKGRGEMEIGEVGISGDSVTDGYWNCNNAKYFVEVGGIRYFRTGDNGFLYKHQLFPVGRIKEMFIVRGRNFYPTDIEEAIGMSHHDIITNGITIFETKEDEEKFVVVAEVTKNGVREPDLSGMIEGIERVARGEYGLDIADILFTTPLSIPRTTSGKIQRSRCKQFYQEGLFKIIGSKITRRERPSKIRDGRLSERVLIQADQESLEAYLLDILWCQFGINSGSQNGLSLSEQGIDSLRLMELVNIINKEIHVNIDIETVLESNSLAGFAKTLSNLLWLRNTPLSGEHLII
jgi:acyl-CoA synthetase (AMP-forming)/AMP-acid ligase II/acyl carrier protein